MRKFLVAIGIIGVVAVSASPAYAASASLDPAGDYGTTPCYASVENFRVSASVQNTSPYVDVDTEGNVGAHVVCPITGDPVGSVDDIEIRHMPLPTIEDLIITH